MKIVNVGSTFRIYSDDLKTYDALPPATYKIDFHPMAGFSLEQMDNFECKEEKVYGSHDERIQKIIRSYKMFDRSLGAIFSGQKGMGKSMCLQLLGQEFIKMDIPVILVPKAYVGIADFIEEIDQECLVIFDEFEKMFASDHRSGFGQQQQPSQPVESQNNLLGLFDGISQKKRLYAITVNDLNRVNEFMLSRPGRFHYHIRFDYPSAAEIEEYLGDKLEEQYHSEIKHVVSFANRVKLNYDSLRAIAFELNQGYAFKSAIADLNILMTDTQRYNAKVVFSDGKSVDLKGQQMNLFSESIRLDGYFGNHQYFSLSFDPSQLIEDGLNMVLPGEFVDVNTTDEEGDPTDNVQVSSVIVTHHREAGVNYKLTV